jgi:hypothetical protein
MAIAKIESGNKNLNLLVEGSPPKAKCIAKHIVSWADHDTLLREELPWSISQ